MSVLYANTLEELLQFSHSDHQLAIIQRTSEEGADRFFNKLMKRPFSTFGNIQLGQGAEAINEKLKDVIPAPLKSDPFYEIWVRDLANVAALFGQILQSEEVGFWLGTERGCRRFHVDYVPMRLLVTYVGTGTEWIKEEGANREAFLSGAPNDEIIRDPSAVEFMTPWDIAIFKGGERGLLHRTPDDALARRSILLRLDHPSFWKNVLKHQTLAAI